MQSNMSSGITSQQIREWLRSSQGEGIFQQGGMLQPGGMQVNPDTTAQQLGDQRDQISRNMPSFGNAQYTGGGLSQLAQGIQAGAQRRAINQYEEQQGWQPQQNQRADAENAQHERYGQAWRSGDVSQGQSGKGSLFDQQTPQQGLWGTLFGGGSGATSKGFSR